MKPLLAKTFLMVFVAERKRMIVFVEKPYFIFRGHFLHIFSFPFLIYPSLLLLSPSLSPSSPLFSRFLAVENTLKIFDRKNPWQKISLMLEDFYSLQKQRIKFCLVTLLIFTYYTLWLLPSFILLGLTWMDEPVLILQYFFFAVWKKKTKVEKLCPISWVVVKPGSMYVQS